LRALQPAITTTLVADPGGGTTYDCSSPPLGRRATTDAAVGLMQAVLAPERLSPLPSRTLRSVFVQDDSRTAQFSMATATSTSISATSAIRGYHLHVVLTGFYSSHSIRAITTLQLRGMSVRRILPLTYSPVSPSVVLPL
jgi:hypothetical protein